MTEVEVRFAAKEDHQFWQDLSAAQQILHELGRHGGGGWPIAMRWQSNTRRAAGELQLAFLEGKTDNPTVLLRGGQRGKCPDQIGRSKFKPSLVVANGCLPSKSSTVIVGSNG